MFFFFFSSRRRHTRFDCDWSSDVCSSDLIAAAPTPPRQERRQRHPDALRAQGHHHARDGIRGPARERPPRMDGRVPRSEEHTSELQSQSNLVCRLLLEKKKKNKINHLYIQFI